MSQAVSDGIDSLAGKEKTHRIYNTLKAKLDEITGPSNRKQIHNRLYYHRTKENKAEGHSNNITDQIKQLENMVTEGHPFVQSIFRNSGKPPCIVLYTEEQLADIRQFCCTGQTVLGVDKTFMLCRMHVTVTCYKQLTMHRSHTTEHPIFVGPMYIHDTSDYETYAQFFHHLKLRLGDTSKLVIGSDDEKALVKAITTTFPDAKHILCTRHLEQNAKQKLTDAGVKLTERTLLMKDLFGDNGIASADDSICFNERCDTFENKCSDVSSDFLDYFRKRLKGLLLTKVNAPARSDPLCQKWTNNNCGSINHVLKQSIDWKTKDLTDLAKLLNVLVSAQFKEIRSALLGSGEFRLSPNHKHFQVTKTQWISMTSTQRSNLYSKLRSHKLSKHVQSSDGTSITVEPRTNGKKPGARKRKINVKTTTIKKVKQTQ